MQPDQHSIAPPRSGSPPLKLVAVHPVILPSQAAVTLLDQHLPAPPSSEPLPLNPLDQQQGHPELKQQQQQQQGHQQQQQHDAHVQKQQLHHQQQQELLALSRARATRLRSYVRPWRAWTMREVHVAWGVDELSGRRRMKLLAVCLACMQACAVRARMVEEMAKVRGRGI